MVGTLALCPHYGLIQISISPFVVDASRKDADMSPRPTFAAATRVFPGDNLDANLFLVEKLRAIARDVGASPAQVAIAWVAAQANEIVPLVGARRRDRLTEALGAIDVKLTPKHLAALAETFPPGVASGERYPESQLKYMDSERRPTA